MRILIIITLLVAIAAWVRYMRSQNDHRGYIIPLLLWLVNVLVFFCVSQYNQWVGFPNAVDRLNTWSQVNYLSAGAWAIAVAVALMLPDRKT